MRRTDIDEPELLQDHEAYHSASLIADLIEAQLVNHPTIDKNPQLKNLAEAALGNLQSLMAEMGETQYAFLKRRAVDYYANDAMDERECDNCGRPYRGPAVYCSLECAEDDA